MRRDGQRGAMIVCQATAGSGKCSDVETACIGGGDLRSVAVTTYSGADQLVTEQDALDEQVTSSAHGRRLECGALGLCQRRETAAEVAMELYPEPPALLGAGREDNGRATSRPVHVSAASGRGDRADERVCARAVQVLAIHWAGLDGWCEGCREAGILAFHPCTTAVWAARVLEELPAQALLAPAAGRAGVTAGLNVGGG